MADRFGVALLRDHCLHCLAARFEALAEERAPPREREVFEAFVAAVAPQVPVLACPHGADVLRCKHDDRILLVYALFGTPPVACCICLWACQLSTIQQATLLADASLVVSVCGQEWGGD